MAAAVIVVRPAFERAAKRLSRAQKDAVNMAVERLPMVFGRPHQHSGVGLRSFGRYFELRVGLGLRILFLAEGGDLHLCTVGNHDAVRAYVKNNG